MPLVVVVILVEGYILRGGRRLLDRCAFSILRSDPGSTEPAFFWLWHRPKVDFLPSPIPIMSDTDFEADSNDEAEPLTVRKICNQLWVNDPLILRHIQ
jgi:hypothetical protein